MALGDISRILTPEQMRAVMEDLGLDPACNHLHAAGVEWDLPGNKNHTLVIDSL